MMEDRKKKTLLFELPVWRSASRQQAASWQGVGLWKESKEAQIIRDNILRFWSASERDRKQRRLHRHLPVP